MPDEVTDAELAHWHRVLCAPALYGTYAEWIAEVRPILPRLIAEVRRLRHDLAVVQDLNRQQTQVRE